MQKYTQEGIAYEDLIEEYNMKGSKNDIDIKLKYGYVQFNFGIAIVLLVLYYLGYNFSVGIFLWALFFNNLITVVVQEMIFRNMTS